MKQEYPANTKLLQYESFISNPQLHVSSIINWLDLGYHQDIFIDYQKNMVFMGLTNAKHHQNILKPITNHSAKKWNTLQDKKMLARIENSCAREMTLLGY